MMEERGRERTNNIKTVGRVNKEKKKGTWKRVG